MITITIIGFTGRCEKDKPISVNEYNRAVDLAKNYISSITQKRKDVLLVGGGGAWCDHIAVELFLTGEYGGLTIHGPCRWTTVEFGDNGAFEWRLNPGKTANYYHRVFSKEIGRNTLLDIMVALQKGANYVEHEYFNTRFTEIAKCDYMVCFTHGKKDRPDKGAHLDVWKKARCRKKHVSLNFQNDI